MERLIAIVRWTLMALGAISLVVALGVVGLVAYQVGPGNRDETDLASRDDVRFVLNWCELGDERIERVIHSHVSARSLTGDHLDAYAIAISHVDIDELTAGQREYGPRWYRGDMLPSAVEAAVDFLGGWRHEIPWFPSVDELRSSEFFVYPWRMTLRGTFPTSADLIFVQPKSNLVFYFSGDT